MLNKHYQAHYSEQNYITCCLLDKGFPLSAKVHISELVSHHSPLQINEQQMEGGRISITVLIPETISQGVYRSIRRTRTLQIK